MAVLIRTTTHNQSRLRLSLAMFNIKMAPMVILKTLATVGLFVVFFVFFGYSSISKFMMRDTVMVTRTTPNQEGLLAPDVMVCPVSQFGRGWKTRETCGTEESMEGVQDCIRNNAYKLDETVNHFNTGMVMNNDPEHYKLINSDLWRKSLYDKFTATHYLTKN